MASFFCSLFFLFLSSALFAATKIHNYNNPSADDKKESTNHISDEIITSDQAAKNKIVNLVDLINVVRENDINKTKEIINLGINPNGVDEEGTTALIVASLRGLDAMVKVLLANGADPNQAGGDGWLPLMSASLGGHAKTVQILLDAGADPRKADDRDTTAMIVAAQYHYPEIIKILRAKIISLPSYDSTDLAETIKTKEWTEFDQTLILQNVISYAKKFHAGNGGFIKKFEEMPGLCLGLVIPWLYYRWLDTQPETANGYNSHWFINTAVKTANWNGVRKFVDKEFSDFKTFTSLVSIFQQSDLKHGDLEVVFPLGKLDTKGKTLKQRYKIAIILASEKQVYDLLEQIVYDGELIKIAYVDGPNFHVVGLFKYGKYYYYYNPNFGEFKVKSLERLAYLIYKNCELYSKVDCMMAFTISSFEETPRSYPKQKDLLSKVSFPVDAKALILSAYIGCLDSLEFYLAQGADPNGEDDEGSTALIVAAMRGYTHIVDRLLSDKRIDSDHAVNSGYNAFTFSITFGHIETIKTFLRHGVDPNGVDGAGMIALGHACFKGLALVVKILLENGADPNKPTIILGRTPLMFVAETGHTELVKILLDYGADPTIKDEQNLSAIDIAKHKGHQECVKLMEQYKVEKEL